jgi:hypothetical protein
MRFLSETQQRTRVSLKAPHLGDLFTNGRVNVLLHMVLVGDHESVPQWSRIPSGLRR